MKILASSLFRRYENNPILTSSQWPYPANAVFNPAATKLGDETLLLVRVEDMQDGLAYRAKANAATR
jgi:predicted GH43/DUF377 family glycosyl hydrolase